MDLQLFQNTVISFLTPLVTFDVFCIPNPVISAENQQNRYTCKRFLDAFAITFPELSGKVPKPLHKTNRI